MGWIYLAESEEWRVPWTNGSNLLPTVKSTDTAKPYYCNVCQKAKSHSHPFGMTCGHCQPINSIDKLPSTLYQAASHARTLALREMEKAWKESEADYSTKLSDLPKSSNLSGFFSKTSPPYALEDFEKSLENLPIFGMTVDGLVCLPQSLEPRILEKGGSCLPTPTGQIYGSNQGGSAGRVGKVRLSLETMAKKNLWPTPCAGDWRQAPKNPAKHGQKIPPASEHALPFRVQPGGKLNPTWVEWLMGFPHEWTELNPWAMQWFQYKPGKPLKD